ncbi:sensor histidine kinase [Paenibacillus sp. PL91]|uniref:sensor histidine kinase n=1 Tax=Paenibacillus sp. PL91 TaxID=2729538 RepID=UPI00145C9A81|nr:HAMP domain-containing sensor histidine kinase [Paenibacillus sp. PL91]MBC9200020.1 HAMP domain-containing histidine kinase [Paenibacillus sp. PL91]
MNLNKLTALLAVQLVIIVGIAITITNRNGPVIPQWILFAVFIVVTGITLAMVLRFRMKLAHMSAQLKRAAGGNFKTRLFAKEDPIWNEVVFSINEIIDQLEQVKIESVKSQSARVSLLSSISHDIRTPLTSIIGYVDALKDGIAASEKEKQEYIAILSIKASALKEMIDEIFMMAKLDADEMPRKEEAIDLAELTRELLIEFLPELKKQGISLETHIPDVKYPVRVDRMGLMRTIGNIVKNAVQYGKEGKVLGVDLLEMDDEYQLNIWDRGPGIPEEELAHIFERSYRSDKARSSESGGSGLGLAIARSLAEREGGGIAVQSMPWEKTSFGLFLPKDGVKIKKQLKNR